MKKLIPALCMLLIAAAMLGTSTYAWFSMNRTVTATGMQVKATTASDLYIANGSYSADAWGAAPTVDAIASGKQVSVAAIANNGAHELTPSSTSNYSKWFYVSNSSEIAVGGSVYTTSPAADKVTDIDYAEATPGTIKSYVHVSRCYVAMKEAGDAAAKGDLKVTVTLAAETPTKDDMLTVLRTAIVVTDGSTPGTTVIYSSDGDTTTKPLSSVTAVNGTATTTVASGTKATVYSGFKTNTLYTVTVYTWFEGQDADCLNANTIDSDEYNIELSFVLE